MNGLPFLDAVVKETLRLHPAILENHHEVNTNRPNITIQYAHPFTKASETTVVPLSDPLSDEETNQLIVPKGTLLVIPINVLQTDVEIWGNDADLFRPSRWLDSVAKPKPGAGGGSLLKGTGLLAFSMG